MNLVAVGVNHTTADVELRERLAFSTQQAQAALASLRDVPGVCEAALLSTCNRTELYCLTDDSAPDLVAWMAEILVGSIGHAAGEYGLPTLFIGIILVPVFGNAAEHFTAITVAGKNKMDLSVGIAIGSSIQIALFVAPAMVLLGWALGVPLTLQFGIFETVATFLAVLVTNFIIQDGESNWLEGAMLLVTYGILALAFFFL